MDRLSRFVVAGIVCLSAGELCWAKAGDSASPLRDEQIGELVDGALAAQLAGNTSEKARYLDLALSAAPTAAAPHWHKGEVLFDGKWRPVAEVEQLVASDPLRQQYRERQSNAAQQVNDQAALADWCEKHGLQDEARVHWQAVLRIDPSHGLARGRLGVAPFEGGLHSKEEVDAIAAERAKRQSDFEKYSKELAGWVRELYLGDEGDRAAILDRFREVRDPRAMAALDDAAAMRTAAARRLSRRLANDQGEALTTDLQCAVVDAFAAMPDHEATIRLMNIAVLAERTIVRVAAAKALRGRPETDYIPQLMGMLQSRIDAEIDVTATPDGMVSLGATLLRRGSQGDQRHNVSMTQGFFPRANLTGEVSPARFYQALDASAGAAYRQANSLRNRIAQENVQIDEGNRRVIEALQRITGENLTTDPDAWWTAWQAYNELTDYGTQTTDTYDSSYEVSYVSIPNRSQCSCFAPGTPVWTQAGVKPIEQIQEGEFVLSQSPDSGELAYRVVLEATEGPATGLMRIDVQGDELLATPGHRFWVAGEGWKMAKFLKPSARLYGLENDFEVRQVEKLESATVYNLVVDEFHTFFVGRDRLLVHDIGCPLPTRAALPGLSKDSPTLGAAFRRRLNMPYGSSKP